MLTLFGNPVSNVETPLLRENGYEEGYVRGAFHFVTELRDEPVNARRRRQSPSALSFSLANRDVFNHPALYSSKPRVGVANRNVTFALATPHSGLQTLALSR